MFDERGLAYWPAMRPTFTTGRTPSFGLVYFAPHHGKRTGVRFRPTQDVNGITWRGPVTVVKATQKSKH